MEFYKRRGIEVGLFCHQVGGWNPELRAGGRNSVAVAGVVFPVDKSNDTKSPQHFVVHSDRDVFGDVAGVGARIILRCSTSDSVFVANSNCADSSCVTFYMRNRVAYSDVDSWFDQFLSLSFAEASQLASLSTRAQAVEFEGTYGGFLDVILPNSAAGKLALRLLCEAFLLKHGDHCQDGEGSCMEDGRVDADLFLALITNREQQCAARILFEKSNARDLSIDELEALANAFGIPLSAPVDNEGVN